MIPCAYCGRQNDPGARFCIDCGRALAAPGTERGTCGNCGANYTRGVDYFCSKCGKRVTERVSVDAPAMRDEEGAGTERVGRPPVIALLNDAGKVARTFTLNGGEAVVGRGEADIRFEHDSYMSPIHTRLERRDGELILRDLGSRNGTWVFVETPARLSDGDLVLVGSQVLRFRRLGYPGPRPPEIDSTRRLGSSVPPADVAVMEQLRGDGSVRDCFHLSPGRTVVIGRETGDWIFPYDKTMSGRHAELRTEDTDFYLSDAGSRNGVAISTRGERTIVAGQRFMIGDQIFRVESA